MPFPTKLSQHSLLRVTCLPPLWHQQHCHPWLLLQPPPPGHMLLDPMTLLIACLCELSSLLPPSQNSGDEARMSYSSLVFVYVTGPSPKTGPHPKVGWGWPHPFRDPAEVGCGPWSVFVNKALLKHSHVYVAWTHLTMTELCYGRDHVTCVLILRVQ